MEFRGIGVYGCMSSFFQNVHQSIYQENPNMDQLSKHHSSLNCERFNQHQGSDMIYWCLEKACISIQFMQMCKYLKAARHNFTSVENKDIFFNGFGRDMYLRIVYVFHKETGVSNSLFLSRFRLQCFQLVQVEIFYCGS